MRYEFMILLENWQGVQVTLKYNPTPTPTPPPPKKEKKKHQLCIRCVFMNHIAYIKHLSLQELYLVD